jgi:hypothetical protein
MKLQKSFLNLFRLYSECEINADVMCSQMLAMQEDFNKPVMMKFSSNDTLIWTITEIHSTLYGYHAGNKQLLLEGINSVVEGKSELIILTN